jgi:uncharacterized protein YabN with tetrapyrrole methylase and pyrophosphatase domain
LDRLSRATVPALDPRQAVKKFENLTTRLQESVAEGVKGENDELFGDLFFLLAFLGQISGTDAEEALKKKVQATVTRFTRLEQRLTEKTGNGILSREEAVELLFGGPEQRNGAAKKV